MRRAAIHNTLLFKIVAVAPVAIGILWLWQAEPGQRISPHTRKLLETVRANDVLAAATLLERGVDPDAQAADGTTALMLAIRNDALGMARLLIDGGADVNLATPDGVTPLTLSKQARQAAVCQAAARSRSYRRFSHPLGFRMPRAARPPVNTAGQASSGTHPANVD